MIKIKPKWFFTKSPTPSLVIHPSFKKGTIWCSYKGITVLSCLVGVRTKTMNCRDAGKSPNRSFSLFSSTTSPRKVFMGSGRAARAPVHNTNIPGLISFLLFMKDQPLGCVCCPACSFQSNARNARHGEDLAESCSR